MNDQEDALAVRLFDQPGVPQRLTLQHGRHPLIEPRPLSEYPMSGQMWVPTPFSFEPHAFVQPLPRALIVCNRMPDKDRNRLDLSTARLCVVLQQRVFLWNAFTSLLRPPGRLHVEFRDGLIYPRATSARYVLNQRLLCVKKSSHVVLHRPNNYIVLISCG